MSEYQHYANLDTPNEKKIRKVKDSCDHICWDCACPSFRCFKCGRWIDNLESGGQGILIDLYIQTIKKQEATIQKYEEMTDVPREEVQMV